MKSLYCIVTGMKMSAAQSAQVMFQALGDFVKKGCGSMTDIRFVIFQDNMVDDFKLAAKQATAKQAKTKASGKTFILLTYKDNSVGLCISMFLVKTAHYMFRMCVWLS